MIEAIGAISKLGSQELARPVSGASDSGVAGFASHLADVVRAGEQAAMSGVQGDAPLQQVVESVMQAERTLTMAISVRDKVVSAYLEMTRMQI